MPDCEVYTYYREISKQTAVDLTDPFSYPERTITERPNGNPARGEW